MLWLFDGNWNGICIAINKIIIINSNVVLRFLQLLTRRG